MNKYWIGLDGTDSPHGGCTTWTISNIIDALYQRDPDIVFYSYPRLIRLNPNIPEKTRGNGALALHIQSNLALAELSELLVSQIRQDQDQYQLNPDKLPGLVVFKKRPNLFLSHKALVKYLDYTQVLQDYNPDFLWPQLNQSHIGAIAAIEMRIDWDFTYELLAYRMMKNCGKPRILADEEVKQLDINYNSLFSSFDYDQNRELIAPAGPDPVFIGIRGESVTDLKSAFSDLTISEQLRSYTIFITNQGTNAHTSSVINDLDRFDVFTGKITIISSPDEIRGGHVFCTARFNTEILTISWFEPTKNLRDKARLLRPGDIIQVSGAVEEKDGRKVVQCESMMIIYSPIRTSSKSPICNNCHQRMTSAGAFSGYKCKSCGHRTLYPETQSSSSPFYPGEWIFAAKSAQRHLTRPLDRQNNRLSIDLISRNHLSYNQIRKLL